MATAQDLLFQPLVLSQEPEGYGIAKSRNGQLFPMKLPIYAKVGSLGKTLVWMVKEDGKTTYDAIAPTPAELRHLADMIERNDINLLRKKYPSFVAKS